MIAEIRHSQVENRRVLKTGSMGSACVFPDLGLNPEAEWARGCFLRGGPIKKPDQRGEIRDLRFKLLFFNSNLVSRIVSVPQEW